MVRLSLRVTGSTLIEVIVAMVIVVTCFTIALSIIHNSAMGNNYKIQFIANQYVQHVINDTRENHSLIDEKYTFESLSIEKKVQFYKSYKELALVTVTAVDVKDRTLITKKILVEVE